MDRTDTTDGAKSKSKSIQQKDRFLDEDWSKFDIYCHIRVSKEHKYISMVTSALEQYGFYHWCVYPHTTEGEHFHICVPGLVTDNDIRVVRRKLVDLFDDRGNKLYSLKRFKNGLHSFVFYAGHEGTKPIYRSDAWQGIIGAQEAKEFPYFNKTQRIEPMMEPKVDDKKDRDWQLTYSNLVCQAVRFRQQRKMQSDNLQFVVSEMMKHTKWKPCHQMYSRGVLPAYEEDFQVRIGKRSKYDMSWWHPKCV